MVPNPKLETLSREELQQIQMERLQSTLLRAYRNVAFYRRTFDAARINLERIRTLEALRDLPFTTREDLVQSYPYDMFAVPLREIVQIHSTSGTSGRPIAVGYTRNDLRHWTECVARLIAAAGVSAHDVAQIALPPNLFAGGLGFYQGAEQVGASVIPSSAAAAPEKQIAILRDFKTTALISTPSYALRLAAALRDMRIHPEALHLRTGLLCGECWSDPLREQIDEGLHISALDNYGLSELMGPGLAWECLRRNGLHINEDHFIAEVIDPKTLQPLPNGEEGELVFTTITKEGFPVIRYRTGDVSSLDESPCPCGRTLARMARVTGRTDNRIFAGGIGFFPSQIEEALLGGEGASPHYQIIVDRVQSVDTVEVRVEVSESMPSLDEVRKLERLRDSIAQRIQTAVGVAVKVTFMEPRSFRDAPRGQVVDRRTR